MAHPQPSPGDSVTRFLRMLAPLPTEVEVVAGSGDPARVLLADVEGDRIIAYGPQLFMQIGLTMTAQLRDAGGGGYDVVLSVAECYFQAGDQTLMHLEVRSIDERPGERDAPRARVSDSALLTVIRSTRMHPGHEFQVRLADLSADGVAFLTELSLAIGDVVRVEAGVDGRPFSAEARIVRLDPASFGRARVGCELIELGTQAREAIGRIAERFDEGSAGERRPRDGGASVHHLAELRGLQTRLNEQRQSREG